MTTIGMCLTIPLGRGYAAACAPNKLAPQGGLTYYRSRRMTFQDGQYLASKSTADFVSIQMYNRRTATPGLSHHIHHR